MAAFDGAGLAADGGDSRTAQKNVAEHVRDQARFVDDELEPRLTAARQGRGHVFFVDAAHFVLGTFLCCLWSKARLFIRAASGRQRYNVLGAWNAARNELVSITNTTYVNAETVCQLLAKIAALGLAGPITLVMDNARYQRCALVREKAEALGIELLFLPSYSPNLNLIERLWKFVKKQTLYGRHFASFDSFRRAIDDCLAATATTHRPALERLMTHRFQSFNDVSFRAA